MIPRPIWEIFFAASIGLLAWVVLTQSVPAQQTQTPMEDALSRRVLAEINTSLACSAELIRVQAALAKAEARLKDLEPKSAIKK